MGSVWLTSKWLGYHFKSLTVAFTVECKEIGFKSENSRRIISGSDTSVTTTYKMDRARFEGISRWTFECTVEILEVHYNSPYDGDRIGRRVVIEKKSPTNMVKNKEKELGEKEKLRKKKQSRKKQELRVKKKEKKKRQNEMEYERRELKHKDKRIKRKMQKYKSKELKK